jgi:hypothetical protein
MKAAASGTKTAIILRPADKLAKFVARVGEKILRFSRIHTNLKLR